ncbi:30S ribosomal protein S5 [Candidatus Bathyarchaeota archaeon]|nr:30S ribosomal protein S5 [Candidatus Bathyarchaeota archaeon]RJS87235.1 MAG: 30S ribosomal protein S5 [Candidatus Bathyarchaeota archaeon]
MSRGRETQRAERLEEWTPRTRLGRLVLEGKISSLEEAFAEGMKVREPEIVDMLLPNLQEEVIHVSIVQKQTDAGEKTRFKSIVVVGNGDGYIGLGSGKAAQVRTAIEKAASDARLNITLVRRGCGSWECGCGEPHSLPFETVGRSGSVVIRIIPGPRGLGLVASEIAKVILRLAGIKDCWTRSYGQTRTVPSFAYAVFDALKKTYEIVTPLDWM